MRTLLFKESIDIVILICFIMFIFKQYNLIFFLCIILLFSLMYLYRLPKRIKPDISDDIMISPCDGKVVKIEETPEQMYKITINISILDVHTIWYPISGIIRNVIHKKGDKNRITTIIENKKGLIRFDQIVHKYSFENKAISNTFIKRGNIIGILPILSKIELYLPIMKTKLFIQENDYVIGKTSSIGKWI